MVVFWTAFLAGQVICFIFDFFRSMRKVSKPSRLSVAIEDVIFCILGFRIFFEVLYLTDNGAVRWYSLAAAILSSILYFCTETKFIMRMQISFFRIMIKILSPFSSAYRFIKKHLQRLKDAAKAYISTKLGAIRQFHTKKNTQAHENTDVI